MQSEIIIENNTAKVQIDGKSHQFSGYRSFHPKAKHVKEFADVAVEFFNVFPSGIMTALENRTVPYSQYGPVWVGEGEYNWDNLKKQTDVFCENAPDGYVVLMIHLDPPDWFCEKYDDVIDTWGSFIEGAGSERWKREAVKYAKALIEKTEELMPGRVYGYQIMCGGTTEWYTMYLEKALDTPSPLHLKTYREWCNDETAEIPTFKEFMSEDDGVFVTDEKVIRYRRFHNEKTAEIVLYFAEKVKEMCDDTKVVSAFYGYMGLDAITTVRCASCGAYDIFKSDKVDIIPCPASYSFRKRYSTSAFRIPVDSITLHNKLYVHEIDAQTYVLKKKNIKPIHMPEIDDTFETIEESASYLRREIGMVLAKGQGYWIFDMMGGWYSDDEMMEEAEKVRKLSEESAKLSNERIAEVALFIDSESNYYVGNDKLSYNGLELQFRDLNLSGFPWDMYLTDDLCEDSFDFDQYKLYIFPSLYAVRPHIKKAIEKLRRMGKNILFMHATGYISENDNLENFTGMELHKCKQSSAKSKTKNGNEIDFTDEIPVFGDVHEHTSNNMEPYYYIDNPDIEIAEFIESNKTSVGIKKRADGSFDAYSAISPINGDVLAKIADEAGVFKYVDDGNVIYANGSIITLYSFKKQNMKLSWKNKVKIKEYFTGEEYIIDENGAG